MSAAHSATVLAGIAPNRRDLLLLAQQQVEAEHFSDSTHKVLWGVLCRYYEIGGDVLPASILPDILSYHGVDEAKQLLYEQTYFDLCARQVADHEVRYALHALKDARSRHRTGVAITTAFEMLEQGVELDKVLHKGHQEARSYLYSEFATIDRLNHADTAPEGDVRLEAERLLQLYADRKSGKVVPGIKSGIDALDKAMGGGVSPGEMALIAAFTGQGKTQILTQWAWHAAVKQGKNIFLGTSETVRDQVYRRLVARHTREPQFNRKGGINTKHIRSGTLTDDDEGVFVAALHDLKHNPAYGKIHIAQVPRGATLAFLEARMKRQGELWEIHWAGFDYLPLLKPERSRQNAQHEMVDLLKDAKVMAVSFYEGRGIPFVSPWQMSQTSYRTAKQNGYYTMANLADTSEAERSADMIFSLLWSDEAPKEALLQSLKLRDTELSTPMKVTVDYRNSYISSTSSGSSDVDYLSI